MAILWPYLVSFLRFSEILVENRYFSCPLHLTPLEGSPSEYCHNIRYGKLEWRAYLTVKKFYDMLSRYDRILACNRQTDRRLPTA